MVKVLLKILSHGLLIAFIVAAFFLYTNRAELFPRWFEQSQAASAPVEERRIERDVAQAPAQEAATVSADATTDSKTDPDMPATVDTVPAAPVAVPPAQSSVSVAGPEPEQALRFRPMDEESRDEPESPAVDTRPVQPDALPAASDDRPVYRPLEEDTVDTAAVAEPEEMNEETPPVQETQLVTEQVEPSGDTDQAAAPEPVVASGDAPVQPVETASSESTAVEQVVEETASSPEPADDAAAEPPPTPAPENLEPEVAALEADNRQPASGEVASREQRLEAARTLYWQRDIGQAAEAYASLGRDYPRDAALWGEIGNFYYSIRQLRPAAMAYYRTVSLLIDQGDTEQARRLLGVLYQLDANRARELDARLQKIAH